MEYNCSCGCVLKNKGSLSAHLKTIKHKNLLEQKNNICNICLDECQKLFKCNKCTFNSCSCCYNKLVKCNFNKIVFNCPICKDEVIDDFNKISKDILIKCLKEKNEKKEDLKIICLESNLRVLEDENDALKNVNSSLEKLLECYKKKHKEFKKEIQELKEQLEKKPNI